MDNHKIFEMDASKVYGLLVSKAVKKDRTREEVDEAACWLTGYEQAQLDEMLDGRHTYAQFFEHAPALQEKMELVKGVVCGVRVENVEDPLMRAIRCLDKLVDELAKGKSMDKILNRKNTAPK